MKQNIIKISIAFILVFILITSLFYFMQGKSGFETRMRENIVDLNEIYAVGKVLVKEGGNNTNDTELQKKISVLQERLRKEMEIISDKVDFSFYFIFLILGISFILILFFYIYIVVIKPFDRLSRFASEVACGNFDFPLNYERKNLFGAFTWAFDNMRREVKKARSCEKEAIENNKTVIATISHDIKTPIASIRAYAEGLQANMDTNPERRNRYLSVIMSKCDEVSKLTNDLFLHSLSDLDRLKMNLEWCKAEEVIHRILEPFTEYHENITILNQVPEGTFNIDIRRLEQVFENLIGNAVKYAGDSRIEISFDEVQEYLGCHIRDYGNGIFDADMPFIFDKFYRGKNAGALCGAGLGLYIVKYIMEQLDGSIQLINHKDGLEAILKIPFKNLNT